MTKPGSLSLLCFLLGWGHAFSLKALLLFSKLSFFTASSTGNKITGWTWLFFCELLSLIADFPGTCASPPPLRPHWSPSAVTFHSIGCHRAHHHKGQFNILGVFFKNSMSYFLNLDRIQIYSTNEFRTSGGKAKPHTK